MNLQDVIATIDGWEVASASELLSVLSTPSIQYVDAQNYTWSGIADVLGNDATERLRLALDQGSTWAIYALSGDPGLQLSRPDIQEKLYLLESSGAVPGAEILAKHVRRMISLLEFHGLQATLENIEQALKAMHLEKDKSQKIDAFADALQAYREAMAIWNGDPATEPKPWP
jgi:hypothetical protein